MGRSSFQHSALVGFGLATLVVLGLLVLASEYTTRHQRAIASVLHAQEIMTTLAAAESQLFRAEANQRAFLVSRDAAFASQREAAEAELRRLAEALAALTAADPPQRRRVAALRSLIDQRTAEYRALQARLGGGASIAPVELLGEGSAARRDFSDRFRAMFDEERRALATRRAEQLDRRAEQRRAIAALGIALALLAGAALWRVARDVAGRRAAELEAQEERLQDAAHARALRLYNETHDRAELLDGILALLAEQARTPVSAFYAHDASSGALRLVARHGTAADIPAVLPLGERVIGDVAREGRPVELPSSDSSARLAAIVPAALRPAALLVAPVSHQGNLLGVLILAAAAALPPGERRFVERLCAHLGVALHNLCQIEGLSRLADRLRHSTAEISRKNEQLQQANRRTGEFVANLS
ncbi:MAG TPA: CHASE3 domain-containing protein, partial [Albitalea sp.]